MYRPQRYLTNPEALRVLVGDLAFATNSAAAAAFDVSPATIAQIRARDGYRELPHWLPEARAYVEALTVAEARTRGALLAHRWQSHGEATGWASNRRNARRKRRMSDEIVRMVRWGEWRTWTAPALAELLGVSATVIRMVRRGETYRDVTPINS
jgi:hypothetical protein